MFKFLMKYEWYQEIQRQKELYYFLLDREWEFYEKPGFNDNGILRSLTSYYPKPNPHRNIEYKLSKYGNGGFGGFMELRYDGYKLYFRHKEKLFSAIRSKQLGKEKRGSKNSIKAILNNETERIETLKEKS